MISEITSAGREESDAGLSVTAAAQDPSSFGSLGKEMARSQKIALSVLGINKGLHSCGTIEDGNSGGGAWPGQGQMAGLKSRLNRPETRAEFPEAYSERLMPESARVQASQDDCGAAKRLAHHHQQQGDQAVRRKPNCFCTWTWSHKAIIQLPK
jgi:hypothetical protein